MSEPLSKPDPAAATSGTKAPTHSLKRNFSWTFLGDAIYAVCQACLIVAIRKLGAEETSGAFAYGVYIVTPLFLATNLGLRIVAASDAHREFEFRDFLSLRLLTTAIAMAILASIALVGPMLGIEKLQPWEVRWAILLVGLSRAVESISEVAYGQFQQLERMDKIAQSMILKGFFSVSVFVLLFWLTSSLLWALLSMALARFVTLMAYDFPMLVERIRSLSQPQGKLAGQTIGYILRPHGERLTLRRLFNLSWPLGIVATLIQVNMLTPRLWLSPTEAGALLIPGYLVNLGQMFITALGGAVFPRLARYYMERKFAAYAKVLVWLVGINVLIGCAAVAASLLFGDRILSLLGRPEDTQYHHLLTWLLVAASINFLGRGLGYGLTATRAFHRFVVPYAVVTVITLTLAAWWIPRYGVMGVAWVACGTSVCNCLVPVFVMSRLHWRTAEPMAGPG